MQYSKGDTVVHPRHGVAAVRGTIKRGAGKSAEDYIELFFEPKNMTIMVPVASMDEVGIRSVATKEEANTILGILEEPADVSSTWSERNADTLSRIQSTDLTQAAMVVRDLTRHSSRSGKPLSAAESSALNACLDTVSIELSLALNLSEDEARALILDKVGSGPAGGE